MNWKRTIEACVVGCCVLLACSASAAENSAKFDTPSNTYRTAQSFAQTGSWVELYECHGKESQGQLDLAVQLWITMAEFTEENIDTQLPPAELFAKFMDMLIAKQGPVDEYSGNILEEKIEGNKAVLAVELSGERVTHPMIREDGRWKFSVWENRAQEEEFAPSPKQKDEVRIDETSDGVKKPTSPTSAYHKTRQLAQQGNWAEVYKCHSRKAQGQFDFFASVGVGYRKLDKDESFAILPRAEVFALWITTDNRLTGFAEEFTGKVLKETIDGTQATLVVDLFGEAITYPMVLERGEWKFDASENPIRSISQSRETRAQKELKTPGHLKTLRHWIFGERHRNGQVPDWLRTGPIYPNGEPATNSLSPDSVASKIVEVTTTGKTGLDIDPSRAGWVWNSSDEQLFAAGLDESVQPTAETHMRSYDRWKTARYRQAGTQRLLEDVLKTLDSPGKKRLLRADDIWPLLIEHKLFTCPMKNPFSPEAVADTIVEVNTSGVTGEKFNPNEAGWIWNFADQEIYIAGFFKSGPK